MSKKFELTSNFKVFLERKLFQIKALVSFGDVKEGDLGGYIEKEENLSHDGNAWVYGNAKVYDNARVCGDAWVCGNAQVSGDAQVCGDAWVCGDAKVSGDARVSGDAWVCGDADYTTVKGFGTEFRTTTFFRCKDKAVRVKCGCFYGDLNEFREQVKNTRSGKIAEEYLMIADLMEKHFSK